MSQKSYQSLKYIIPLLVICLGVFGFYTLRGKTNLASIAEKQIEAIRSHDISKAYYDYTTTSYQRDTSLNDFRKMIKIHPVLSDNSSASFYQSYHDEQKGILASTLTSIDGTMMPAVFLFKKEKGEWKISNIELMDFGVMRTNNIPAEIAIAEPSKPQFTKEMKTLIEPVTLQLKLLQAHDIEKAYNEYSSKEFMKATPLDAFKDFLASFPELTDHKAVTFNDARIEEGKGKVSATLMTEKESYPLEYVLVQQEGIWKIWGFRVMPAIGSSKPITTEERESIINKVKGQLELLKVGSIEKAYEDYSSKEFKKVTSLTEFKEFVSSYPEIQTFDSLRFGDSKIENGLRMVTVFLKTKNNESIFNYWLMKNNGDWKVWGIQVQESVSYPPVDQSEQVALNQVVEGQLKALQDHDYSKAFYAFVSDEFESITPLSAFKGFISNHPILTDYKTYHVDRSVKDGNLRLIRITLEGDRDSQTVDYRLIDENGSWKIWGIQFLQKDEETPQIGKTEALQLILEQLQAIQEGDLSKAYYAYTSKDFQYNTSKEMFNLFLKSHPAVQNNSGFKLENYNVNQNIATVVADLTSQNNLTEAIEYSLIYDNDRWKILGMNATESQDSDEQALDVLQITKAVIGNQIDSDGVVIQPKQIFRSDDTNIVLNLYIENGKVDDILSVTLEHMPTDSSIPTATTQLANDGESIVTFTFTPPEKGWPAGKYRFLTNTSTGLSTQYTFSVLEY